MLNIVIVGATGAVGQELIMLLEDREIKFDNLKLIASKQSVGKVIYVNTKKYIVEEFNENCFDGYNFAIFTAGAEISKLYSPYAIKAGCIIIDNSSAFRMDPKTPLVIPEVNGSTKTESGIIANPNCSTILLLMVLYPLYKYNKIKRISVSTYQSASGAGMKGIHELEQQVKAYNEAMEPITDIFGRPYLFNVFSHNSAIDLQSGFNEEEIKIINETHKILNDNNILINVSCMRVPTKRSHLETVDIEFENETSVDEIKNILSKASGVIIYDNPEKNEFPEPIITANKDDVYVGRIRQSYHNNKKNFLLMLSGDQILKGAALNAIQILELFIKNN